MKRLAFLAMTIGFIAATTLANAQSDTSHKSASHAGMVHAGDLMLSNAWTRATPKSAPTGAGFVTIVNAGDTDDRLVAVKSGIASRNEIHLSSMKDGVMSMRQLEDGIPIPGGETVTLKPGGLHMMFIGLKNPIRKDSIVEVTLIFERAGEVDINLTAAAMGAKAHQHDHGQ